MSRLGLQMTEQRTIREGKRRETVKRERNEIAGKTKKEVGKKGEIHQGQDITSSPYQPFIDFLCRSLTIHTYAIISSSSPSPQHTRGTTPAGNASGTNVLAVTGGARAKPPAPAEVLPLPSPMGAFRLIAEAPLSQLPAWWLALSPPPVAPIADAMDDDEEEEGSWLAGLYPVCGGGGWGGGTEPALAGGGGWGM
jgi:hypothetical protein